MGQGKAGDRVYNAFSAALTVGLWHTPTRARWERKQNTRRASSRSREALHPRPRLETTMRETGKHRASRKSMP